MAKKEFVVTGRISTTADGDLAQGDILQLEVGKDGLPVEKIYRNRVRPAGRRVSGTDSTAEAQEQAKKIISDAEAQADKILADAHAEAAKVSGKK